MKGITFRYTYLLPLVMCAVAITAGCYKDKGNYDYLVPPPAVIIDTNSYITSYQKVFDKDTLFIKPQINYAGEAGDLTYEWQMRDGNDGTFFTVQKGKDLALEVGETTVIPSTGSYDLRFAVANKKLASDSANGRANMIFSRIITLKAVSANYLGLMVLHGDGTQSDVGLIEDNFFLPKSTMTVTTRVTPGFWSSMNEGEKIAGVGKQVEKIGYIETFGSFTYGTSNIYVFTDKVNVRGAYLNMRKAGDYSALFTFPANASGKPGRYVQIGTNQSQALVDNGRLFYSGFIGPLFNADFNYYAAPYVALQGVFSPSRGAVIFDTISKAFLYCNYPSGTSGVYKFTDNAVGGVNLQPNNMQADLVYMDCRGRTYNSLAVMKDKASGNNYLAEFNFTATDLGQVSVGRYPMEGLPGYGDIRYYTFGRELNMVYYATNKTVYQYLYQSNNTAQPVFTAPADETITLMKVIKYEYSATSNTYQFSNKQMVVGTVDAAGKGKLYAFDVNTVSGAIQQKAVFEGFGRIYDAAVKDQ